MSWVCDKCGSSKVFWNKEISELVCQNCGKVLSDKMPRLIVLSKDTLSERGTCEACGLENAHLVAKCKKCGKKVCLENCIEDLLDGLCIWCEREKNPPPPEGDKKRA
jgi:hypothetical protein